MTTPASSKPAACCGGPALDNPSACCVRDANAKAAGRAGCGCTDKPPLPVAVIGAGPVGLAAAARLIERGIEPLVLEAGASVGASLLDSMNAGHGHVHDAGNYNAAFGIGIGLNTAFVAIEAFYGWKVGSLALLADAGHNLSDVIGLVLAWGGALAGKLRPDVRHTYGWKRASILAAFANALLLLVAMGSLAWEAVHRLQSPAPVEGVTIIVVAGIGIVINTITALLFMRGRERDLNIRGAFLHMAADALVSAGVVVAGGLMLAFGWNWLDPVVSLIIAAVIVGGTWRLFRQSLHLLFDGVPDSVDLREVQALLESLPGVEGVHDLHVWAMGTSEIALTAHLIMPAGGPVDDAFLESATRALHERFDIDHVTLQVVRAPFTDACLEKVPALDRDQRARSRPELS
jgi:cobalt-zinc-cadmium efflux system protein